MDNMIISGVRIYFPRPGERLPTPDNSFPSLAIKGTVDGRCCLLAYSKGKWFVMSLPEYNDTGKAIMEAVKHGKRVWR